MRRATNMLRGSVGMKLFPIAQSAARALVENTELDARTIVENALNIAADICIYTNRNLTIEELEY